MESKTRRRKTHSKSVITEDLVTEIISRVPASDLMRFSCVSKSWRSLICIDTYFATLQIQRNASLQQRPFLIIDRVVESASGRRSFYNYLIDMDSIEGESVNLREISTVSPFHDGDDYPHRDALIIGSCQGLLLLQQWPISYKMAISNPATRKHRVVPPNPAGETNFIVCGFGYDRAHDCYKVVTKVKLNKRDFELMIYNVNRDMWYQHLCGGDAMKDYHQGLELKGMRCVDGALYWCVDVVPREIKMIVCFVLATEEFHVLKKTDFGEVKYYPNMVELDGRLGLCMEGLGGSKHEVWMIDMECDACNNYSWRWTKLLSVTNPDAMLPPPYCHWENVLKFHKCFSRCRTKILYDVAQRELFWYDMGRNEFRKLRDDIVNNVYGMVRSFVPSLVGIGIF